MSNKIAQYGHHFIVGIDGIRLNQTEKEILSELKPLGVIIFKRNINQEPNANWQQELLDLKAEIIKAIGKDNIIFSIDHEGGRVNRLREPISQIPYACTWQENTESIASTIGKELKALGFNLNFAPVVDINSNPDNPVIGERAFCSDPNEVARLAKIFIKAQEKEGVLACAKHFPGHGETTEDSHFSLPKLDFPLSTLRNRELIPFRAAIESGINLIMTAHINFLQVDPNVPATFSKKILQGILREELNYKNCIISDDLEMLALSTYSFKEKALNCLKAGVDILLIGQSKTHLPLQIAKEMAIGLEEEKMFGGLSDSRGRVENLLNRLKYKGSE